VRDVDSNFDTLRNSRERKGLAESFPAEFPQSKDRHIGTLRHCFCSGTDTCIHNL